MALMLYVVGLVVFVSGLGWLATSLGVNAAYVNVVALALLGVGLVTAVLRARLDTRA